MYLYLLRAQRILKEGVYIQQYIEPERNGAREPHRTTPEGRGGGVIAKAPMQLFLAIDVWPLPSP
jgi:hypothetical protein